MQRAAEMEERMVITARENERLMQTTGGELRTAVEERKVLEEENAILRRRVGELELDAEEARKSAQLNVPSII